MSRRNGRGRLNCDTIIDGSRRHIITAIPVKPQHESSTEEMLAWIDGSDYDDLLRCWRFTIVGSPWTTGVVGDRLAGRMKEFGAQLSDAEKSAASKRVGWSNDETN